MPVYRLARTTTLSEGPTPRLLRFSSRFDVSNLGGQSVVPRRTRGHHAALRISERPFEQSHAIVAIHGGGVREWACRGSRPRPFARTRSSLDRGCRAGPQGLDLERPRRLDGRAPEPRTLRVETDQARVRARETRHRTPGGTRAAQGPGGAGCARNPPATGRRRSPRDARRPRAAKARSETGCGRSPRFQRP